jgi:autotransporter translocation and assembly factor TamB
VHVLTKIFIVLVSLLAVLLVPLVVVYAYNENSYQTRYQEAEAQTIAVRAELETERTSKQAEQARTGLELQKLSDENRTLQSQASQQASEIRALELRLAEAESNRVEIDAKLTTLASALDAGHRLTASLIEEVRNLRREALAAERERVQLDESLRDAQAQLDVAVEARRALQEQLQRLKDEQATALGKIAQYTQVYGELKVDIEGPGAVPITEDLDATIIAVRRSSDQVLAEIDAGSRDGVQEGWVMTIGHGGNFVGRLRIISVDINRATGIVELEDVTNRRVEIGYLAYARAGR